MPTEDPIIYEEDVASGDYEAASDTLEEALETTPEPTPVPIAPEPIQIVIILEPEPVFLVGIEPTRLSPPTAAPPPEAVPPPDDYALYYVLGSTVGSEVEASDGVDTPPEPTPAWEPEWIPEVEVLLSETPELVASPNNKIAFNLGDGEAAGNTVRIIGAAFDGEAVQQRPDWVGIGLELFDSGLTMLQVCELVIGILGQPSDEAFVNVVYENVVGALPSDFERDFYVGLLQGSGGTMTQAELLMFAANSEANAINIDIVGLQQSGVEFV